MARMSVAELRLKTLPDYRSNIIDSESKIPSVNRVSVNLSGSRNKLRGVVSIEETNEFGKKLPVLNDFIETKLKFKTKRDLKISEAD